MAINTARTSTEDGESPSPKNPVAEVEESSLRWTSKVVEEICRSLYVSKSVSRALSSVCRSARSCWHWLPRLAGLIRGVGEVSCPARAPGFDVDMREVYRLWRAINKVARERENERTRCHWRRSIGDVHASTRSCGWLATSECWAVQLCVQPFE
jgi:hypothetical protein